MESKNEELSISTQLDELPPIVLMHLDKNQKDYLRFERKKFKVIGTPKVQTIHIGSVGKGHSTGGGLGTALNDSWGIFGNISQIKMATLNQFKTDIQLRLEDEETHEKTFFEKSFPVEMTLSIEPGDTLSIFTVRAEEKNLPAWEDKKFLHWTPFIAQVDETKQLLPLGKVPEAIGPASQGDKEDNKFWLVYIGFFVIGAILIGLAAASSSSSNNSSSTNSPNVNAPAVVTTTPAENTVPAQTNPRYFDLNIPNTCNKNGNAQVLLRSLSSPTLSPIPAENLSTWTDNEIAFAVPASFSPGIYAVIFRGYTNGQGMDYNCASSTTITVQ